MDVRYLEYVIEMAREGNMTKAAKKLFVTQSSLSQYLTKLEGELGTTLFERTRGELKPTKAGRLYLEAAIEMVEIRRHLLEEIQGISHTGKIVLGITSNWGLDMLPRVLLQFKRRYPNMTIEVMEDDAQDMLDKIAREEIDMALMTVLHPEHVRGQWEELGVEEILFGISESHWANQKIQGLPLKPEDMEIYFSRDSFILSKKGSTVRILADQILKHEKVLPDTVCVINSMSAIGKMVAQGIGVAFMPASSRRSGSGIRYYSLDPKICRYNGIALRKSLRQNDPERYLLELFRLEYPTFE